MKKYILGSLLAGALVSSCNLDETPASSFSQEEAMKSETLIYVNTVAAVYNQMGLQLATGVADVSNFLSDEFVVPGRLGDWVDGGVPQNKFTHNLNPGQGDWNSRWNDLYSGIAKANAAIETLAEYDKQEFIAELSAYRAMLYYVLMDLYGNVPIVTSTTQSTTETAPTARPEVFKWVWKELTTALPLLSDAHSPNSGTYYGRMTQGVAYMTLAKMALNAPIFQMDPSQANWAKDFLGSDMTRENTVSDAKAAEITAKMKAINLSIGGFSGNALETVIYCVEQLEAQGYKLSSTYAENFKVANETSVENIYTLPNDDKIYMRGIDHQRRSWHYNHAGHSVYKGFSSWNGPCATVALAQKYGYTEDRQEEGFDPRFKVNFYIDRDYVDETGERVLDGKNNDVDPKTSELALEYMPLHVLVDYDAGRAMTIANKPAIYAGIDDESYFQHVVKCAGARHRKYEYDFTTTNSSYPANDRVVWRYGDALLMKAEAQYRLGQTADALANVNKIRERAGVEPLTALTMQDISDERMKELAWEGTRRQDMIRYAIMNQPTADRYEGCPVNGQATDYTQANMNGHTYVLPIPATQISLNANLKQNWGY